MKLSNWVYVALISIVLASCSSGESNKGDQLYAEGRYEEAINAYDAYLVNRPKNVQALYNRGRSHEELGAFDEAERDFLAALSHDAKNSQVLLSLSNLYQKQKRHTSALLYAEYAVEVAGAPAMAYFMKGRALHQLGNSEEAYKEYSTAIKMNKNYGQAYYYRGLLKFATDRVKSGCDDMNAALKVGYEDAREAMERYCQ
ncbi:tetratricopeptide repeat protein [Mongoliibacter ruber]|uniref:TPR repeat protein n=1 Tax=Mongoliibacter ruber TaxID=1750599 RepID=A0A2T0WUJ9_9BACT|nr:tetratricopeptide repeat protein [Mongoliibacter ruber]PRY90368.1 TPR repeat protein [Mongoliibacter ruber]